MAHHEISDDFWSRVELLLEPFKRKKPGDSPPLEFRRILNGIFHLLKTGCQRGYLPACHGSKSAVHAHFQRWVHAGVFAEMFRLSVEGHQALNGIEWEGQAMDGASMQAPVRGQPVCLEGEALGRNPTDRGRSGSKTHLHVDQQGIPLGAAPTGAKARDSRSIFPTLAAAVLSRPDPTPDHPQHLRSDKGHDDPRVEREVKEHAYIPHIRRIGEEKIAAGEQTHLARRQVVERTIAWIKGFRAIRARYFCQAQNCLAMIHLACARMVSRKLETV
ncbi:MAG: IS5 family transposase [Albidovulum sp.]